MFRIIVIKFFPFLYLALSILILIYVFHKDQFIYEGNKFEYYKNYYIIFILNLIFSITIILINKIRIYFFIILLSVFFFKRHSFDTLKKNCRFLMYSAIAQVYLARGHTHVEILWLVMEDCNYNGPLKAVSLLRTKKGKEHDPHGRCLWEKGAQRDRGKEASRVLFQIT